MRLQDAIHAIEEGAGKTALFRIGLVAAAILFALVYMVAQFRGLGHNESIDSAQLARNIARGEGYTTDVIRPLAIWQMQRWEQRETKNSRVSIGPADIKNFPDTINPPLYPYILAGLFKATWQSFQFTLGSFQSSEAFPPEKIMAAFGVLCSVASAFFGWLIARRLFDGRVAFFSLVLVWTADLFWGTAVSGLVTPLIMLLVTASAWCLVRAHGCTEDAEASALPQEAWVAAAAALQALAALASYTWFWLLAPTAIFVFFTSSRRWLCTLVFVGVFLAVPLPWALRNIGLTGNPLGLAWFYPDMTTTVFPGDAIFSQLRPDFMPIGLRQYGRKWALNFRFFTDHWPILCGGLIVASFFVVALLHRFKRAEAASLHYWATGALVAVVFASCFGPLPEMDLSLKELDPIRHDNAAIAFLPIMAVFASVSIWLAIDRLPITYDILKNLVAVAVAIVHMTPVILTIMPPREWPVKYPPFYPTMLYLSGTWTDPGKGVVTDLPAGVAWYGDKPALLLPSDMSSFFELNDFVMADAFQAMLLTPMSRDSRFATDIQAGRYRPWEALIIQRSIPPIFPFQFATFLPPLNGYYYMSDSPRWARPLNLDNLQK